MSESGLFADGDGGECACCGFPGQVMLDAESDPYWWTSDDQDAVCGDPECEECSGGE